MTRTLFIADLHLTPGRPAAVAALFGLLAREAARTHAIYVLGDLFEYWVGDDDLADPFNASIAHAFARTAAGGAKVCFMHGNRDFLVGEAFCRASGMTPIDDPHRLELHGRSTVLMHGDTLCTEDLDYQNWRRIARSAEWQREFLSLPLAQRHQRVQALRERSSRAILVKPAEIMDVNDGAVREAMRTHDVDLLIHGHTHRPAHHRLEVDGKPCERWVLPEWYGRGGYLVAEAGGLRLETL